MSSSRHLNRREFLGTATAAAGIVPTIIPSIARGGNGRIAPSDKINVGLVGCGTMAMRILMSNWLEDENLHFAAIADPNRDSDDYRDWSQHGLRDNVREFIGNDSWGSKDGIRAGRIPTKELIDGYYANVRGIENYSGVAEYEDYREMMANEQNLDAIICMTPEHLHGPVCIAALQHGLHIATHKTLANTMHEVRTVVNMAKESDKVTHLLAFQNDMDWVQLKAVLDAGVIGKVKEIHNWSNRPVWPQGWLDNPTEKMRVPRGMNWDLWLGSVPDRPYHLDYTHALFRGWFDFGSGCMGDMGNYSLWRVFRMLNPGPALIAEARASTSADINVNQSRWRRSAVAFPHASTIHFVHKDMEIFWYDGGIKPRTPMEVLREGGELQREGMLLVGEYGKILGDFHGRRFKLLPSSRHDAMMDAFKVEEREVLGNYEEFVDAVKNGRKSLGSFESAQDIAEATCLGTASLRAGRRIEFDPENMRVTNVESANKFLTREYRAGWEI